MDHELFYKDKPLFGLDIGFSNIKVMELNRHKKKHAINGYGIVDFDAEAIKDGVIVKPEVVAKAANKLFDHEIIGHITTRRVALSVPSFRTFNRTLQLPKLTHKEILESVQLEAQQYIPVPIDDLYIDYEVLKQTKDGLEILVVASPRKIIDSYKRFAELIGLEVVAIESNINACARLFMQGSLSDIPSILIDFGSVTSDITILDNGLVVTGTAEGGGDTFTSLIADKLNVTKKEAYVIKTKYGLSMSKKQKEITESMTPVLEDILKEIRRMIRYYDERSAGDNKISQIVTMGGGANMPGLSEFMTNRLRLPVRTFHPWQEFDFSGLQPPTDLEKSMYVTVAGLSLINPKEIFA